MESDFKEHLSLFKEVLHDQLIGYCDAPGHFVFITEYHLHSKGSLQQPQELHERLQLCSSYAELLVFLHDKGCSKLEKPIVYRCLGIRNLQNNLTFGTIDQSVDSIQICSQSKPGASFR